MQELLKNGKHQITAITREGSTAEIPSGEEVRKVNYDDRSSLVSALRGHDLFIVTMGVMAPPDTHDKLVEAAGEAKVPWIIPNEYGGDTNSDILNNDVLIGVSKKAARERIEQLGMSWIGIACGFWYEFSLCGGTDRYGFDFNNRTLTWFDNGDVKINTSTFPQTGRAVSNLLSLKIFPDDENDKSPTLSHWRNRFVHVTSFCVSQKDMFEAVLRVTGTKASDWTQTTVPVKDWYEEGKSRMQNGDRLGSVKMVYGRYFFPDAPADFEKHGVEGDNERLGLPKEDLDEYTMLATEMAKDSYIEKQYAGMMLAMQTKK